MHNNSALKHLICALKKHIKCALKYILPTMQLAAAETVMINIMCRDRNGINEH